MWHNNHCQTGHKSHYKLYKLVGLSTKGITDKSLAENLKNTIKGQKSVYRGYIAQGKSI